MGKASRGEGPSPGWGLHGMKSQGALGIDQPEDFLGQETTETGGLARKWFWHKTKTARPRSAPP